MFINKFNKQINKKLIISIKNHKIIRSEKKIDSKDKIIKLIEIKYLENIL